MAPDINSIPPSPSTSASPLQQRAMQVTTEFNRQAETPSPRPSSHSLAAAASMNAAETSRRSSISRGSPIPGRYPSGRRRSQIAMTLNLNDPTLPSPGELSAGDHRLSMGNSFSASSPTTLAGRETISTGDPHHQRQPSLGDIHNELEQEQEAQVNRMLQMIRAQQQQLDNLQRPHPDSQQTPNTQLQTSLSGHINGTNSIAVLDEPTSSPVHPVATHARSGGQRSREPSSASRSPALRAQPFHDSHVNGVDWYPSSPLTPSETLRHVSLSRRNSMRDESVYYQAETATLQRENQMLRMRIRELEKQVSEGHGSPANVPSVPSNLATSPSLDA